MKSFLKHIWWLFVFASVGVSWMLLTVICLDHLPYWITTPESRILHAVLLPAVVYLGGGHMIWMLQNNWLTEE